MMEATARLRMGARFAWILAAVSLPGALPAPAQAALDEGPGPLPWRVAGRVGFTVDAVTSPDSAGLKLDVYVRIPPATLEAMQSDTTRHSVLRVSARLRNRFGGKPREVTRDFGFDHSDSTGFGKVVGLQLPVQSGAQRLLVRVEDVLSRKRGIAYTGRQVTENARVEGEISVPAPQAGRDLSDLEFIWTEREPGNAAAFRRGGRVVIPNPERLYGLYAGELRASFSARGNAGEPHPWHWVARMRDAGGHVMAERETTAAAAAWLEDGVVLDISTVPAGGYDLELKAWQDGVAGELLRRGHFSVAWQKESWMRNPGDVSDDVHFLLQPADEDSFALLHPGEQEQKLVAFWQRRDPTPGTAVNEAREAFHRRVERANRQWGRLGLGKGMFSDMGRTYIRYGEPGEVIHQVIPTGDETLDRVLAELSASEDRPIGDVPLKGPGADARPFELWIYEGEIAVPFDADPGVRATIRRKRLVFLFVDEHGLGDYRLRYSTE